MPQARSGGSRRSSSSSGSRSTRSSVGSRSTRAKSSRSGSTSRASTSRSKGATSRSKSTASRSTAGRTRSSGTRARAGSAEAQFEAAAQRLRKLNERIIDAARDAGESTLSSYEKALKSIASTIERGPGSSDVEWISNLATAQAKFIRDVTASWTKAARKMLK